jgi:pyruvate formate lyase activating enzyme
MNYAVKLDTNGSNPDILTAVIELGLVDFIAMDIKTSLARYEDAVGVKPDLARIKASIGLIIKSGLNHQFRTTLVSSHCSREDLKDIQGYIGSSRHYILQSFIPMSNIIDPQLLTQKQYTSQEINDLRLQFQRVN